MFAAAHGLSLAAAVGGSSSLRCAGFSLQGLLLVRSVRSRAHGPQELQTWAQRSRPRAPRHRLSRCGGTGLAAPEPVGSSLSSALAAGFVSTVPPGQSQEFPLDGMVLFPGWGLWSDCVSAFPPLCD